METGTDVREHWSGLAGAVEDELDALAADHVVERLWRRDHTVWQDDPTEVADRLGWLTSPGSMKSRTGVLVSFATGAAAAGFTNAVLLGMGGSSLFAEVVAATFGADSGALALSVLDTTDPSAIARMTETLPLDRTLFVAASKSGTTVETTSHVAHFWDAVGKPEQFVAVSDPGSPLSTMARDREFRAVFENQADIGGRYSALSHFGLLPAALVGVDLDEFVDRALQAADRARWAEHDNFAVRLGALFGVSTRAGRDKLTVSLEEPYASFGAWVEQLVAESLGKDGTGLVPVVDEVPREAGGYGADRTFVSLASGAGGSGPGPDPVVLSAAGHPVVEISLDDPYDLAREVIRFEVATAVAGRLLGVNPFDQPDVQAAKDATARALEQPPSGPAERGKLAGLLDQVREGDYLAVQAFADPGSDLARRLRDATYQLAAAHGVAGTFGLGPRFLHSTGQLHKGGPRSGVFLQVVTDDPLDVPIPGASYGFSALKRAQADGDLTALRERGRRVERVEPDEILDAAS